MFSRMLTLLVAIVVLSMLVLSCNKQHRTDTLVQKTFDARRITQITNYAILAMVSENSKPGEIEKARLNMKRAIVDNQLTSYRRFLIAQDSTSWVFVTYPDLQIVREGIPTK